MNLDDLIDPKLLREAIDNGLVARKVSPDGTKHLYCYTHKAQFQRAWNEATINARGVTVDAETGEILARPFPKFFNYGDPNAPEIEMDTRVWAYDKLDGSLVVLQPDGTMTSKGSFTSDVAAAATKLYQERYADKWTPKPGHTYCFEFTSPEHRIVLDYGETADLTLIGVLDNEDGFIYDPAPPRFLEWPGPRAELLADGKPFSEVLAMPPRENAEGLVVIWGLANVLKLKQSDYLAMHAIVTNTNAITVWEAMAVNDCIAAEGMVAVDRLVSNLQLSPERIERAIELGPNWLEKLSEGVPDEFHDWLRRTAGDLSEAFDSARESIRDVAALKPDAPRRFVVEYLQEKCESLELPWNIAMDYWANDYRLALRSRAAIWRHVRPTGARWGMTGMED